MREAKAENMSLKEERDRLAARMTQERIKYENSKREERRKNIENDRLNEFNQKLMYGLWP